MLMLLLVAQFHSQERYCNFGEALASGDLDGEGHTDLVVGAPFSPGLTGQEMGEQRGTISVLYADPMYSAHQQGLHL